MKRFYYQSMGILMSSLLLMTGAAVCAPHRAVAKAKKKVTEITVKKPDITTLYLKKGERYKVKYKVKPANASNRKVSFSSSRKKVATVSSKGVIRARKPGKAAIRIRAKDGSRKKAVIQVTVCRKLKKIKKVRLRSSRNVLYTDGTADEKKVKLTALLSPSKSTVKKVVYKTSDKKIATVSAKGVVTAKAEGTVTITAYAADGRGAKAGCKIRVQKKEKTQNGNGTGNQPVTNNPSGDNPDSGSARVQFRSPYHFRSYSVIHAALPDGVKTGSITALQFVTENEKSLAFRLYAGSEKTASKEMTKETTKIVDEVTGTETAVVDGVTVPKTNHKLSLQKTDSTRIVRKAGEKGASVFPLDSDAARLLQAESGEQLQFSLYPHNCQPSYELSRLQIQAGGKTYEIPLTKETITGKEGAALTYLPGK